MMWSILVVSVAYGADAILALKVIDSEGRVALEDELVLPSERMLLAPNQKHTLGVYASTFDQNRAVIELVAGPTKDGKPKPKVTTSFEVDLYQEQTKELLYKDDKWTVVATLGQVWDAPEPAAATPDTERYLLVWDDAKLFESAKEATDAAVTDPKKAARAMAKAVKERELPEGRTDATTQASPSRFVAAHGETHLEFETIPDPAASGAHCQVGGPPLEVSPTIYVAPLGDVVSRVTSREVAGRLPDGSGYRVAAGVPVVEEAGKYRVNTGGLSFLIEATEEDLAFYYRPSVHFEAGESTLHLAPGTVGTTALGEVTWAGPTPLPIVGMRGVKAPMATVRVPCAEVRLAPNAGAFVR